MQKLKRDYLGRPFSGIHVEYFDTISGDVVDVARCLDKDLYVNPGYYAATCNGLPYSHPLHKQRFASALSCAKAIQKAGGKAYNLFTDNHGKRVAANNGIACKIGYLNKFTNQ